MRCRGELARVELCLVIAVVEAHSILKSENVQSFIFCLSRFKQIRGTHLRRHLKLSEGERGEGGVTKGEAVHCDEILHNTLHRHFNKVVKFLLIICTQAFSVYFTAHAHCAKGYQSLILKKQFVKSNQCDCLILEEIFISIKSLSIKRKICNFPC